MSGGGACGASRRALCGAAAETGHGPTGLGAGDRNPLGSVSVPPRQRPSEARMLYPPEPPRRRAAGVWGRSPQARRSRKTGEAAAEWEALPVTRSASILSGTRLPRAWASRARGSAREACRAGRGNRADVGRSPRGSGTPASRAHAQNTAANVAPACCGAARRSDSGGGRRRPRKARPEANQRAGLHGSSTRAAVGARMGRRRGQAGRSAGEPRQRLRDELALSPLAGRKAVGARGRCEHSVLGHE